MDVRDVGPPASAISPVASGDALTTERPTRYAVSVGVFAGLVRLVWVSLMSRAPKGLSDLRLYPGMAGKLASGRGYISLGGHPSAYYPPGYPLFLGLLRWSLDRVGLGEHLIFIAGLAQALLGGIAAAAVVIVGWRIGGSSARGLRLGLIAGVLVALWPNLVVYSSVMLSESLFIAMFCVMLWMLVTMVDPSTREVSRSRLVLTGVLLGGCTLIRPQAALLLVPSIMAVWALSLDGWRKVVRCSATLIITVVMVLTPWTVRNAVQLNSFVPVSTNTGDNLCMGFNPDATGGFMAARNCDTGEFYVDGPAAEVRRDARNRAYAIRWALSNPGRLPALSLKKLEFTFANDTDGLRALESFGSDPFLGDRGRRVVGVGMNAYFFGVFALALVGSVLLARGAWRDRSRDSAGLMLLVVTVAGLVPPVISFGEPRFKVPLAPCFALLAAVAIEALWGRWFGPADRAASQAR